MAQWAAVGQRRPAADASSCVLAEQGDEWDAAAAPSHSTHSSRAPTSLAKKRVKAKTATPGMLQAAQKPSAACRGTRMVAVHESRAVGARRRQACGMPARQAAGCSCCPAPDPALLPTLSRVEREVAPVRSDRGLPPSSRSSSLPSTESLQAGRQEVREECRVGGCAGAGAG